MAGEFNTLDKIFTMFTPRDLAGIGDPSLGGRNDPPAGPMGVFANWLENDARGVLKVSEIVERFERLTKSSDLAKTALAKSELQKYFQLYTTIQGMSNVLGKEQTTYQSKDGSDAQVHSMKEIIGKDAVLDPKFDIALILSNSPFFHPARRHTKRVETFLNSMPSTVVSQLVPYLDIEFQFTRDPSPALQSAGQLKFLLGGVKKDELRTADEAMLEGHQVDDLEKKKELDFAGMEMFTSPQTLFNPTPNLNVGTGGVRYVDVLDPTRPFASIENVTITVTPSVGWSTYKKAQLTIKLHDRSRLSEISELLRPRTYSSVVIWLTYGWRAPLHLDNPYFNYINNNMLMREAYGIVNSNFTFDQVGQATIKLELFTKGVLETRTLKVSDTSGDMNKQLDDIKRLGEQIAQYRKRLKLDPPEGINKEIRYFQVLDAAQVGAFPDFSTEDVQKALVPLRSSLASAPDQDAAKGLISALNKLYKSDTKDVTRFDLKKKIESTVTKSIEKKFTEVMSGADPFLPTPVKNSQREDQELEKEVANYNKPATTQVSTFRNSLVSFGKLFSTFAVQAIHDAQIVDELQVFFYAFNESCGPLSSRNIAEFPVDMPAFLDQYRDHVIRKGGERITLDEFMQLLINAQILDNRAVGYGLREFYEPYDKNKEAQFRKDQEGNFESALARLQQKHGPFKKPVIETYIETSHERAGEDGDSDILMKLNYSAKDASSQEFKDKQGKRLRTIMRIHIYDKQLSPFPAEAMVLRGDDGQSFRLFSGTGTDAVKEFTANVQKGLANIQPLIPPQVSLLNGQHAAVDQLQADPKSGVKTLTFGNNRAIKDLISKSVPTITYGSNGTTIKSANLASKNEPLLSTVNMIRTQTVTNKAAPNGSGEGGIPLRVIPATLNLTTLGCPLACMAQLYFCDFQTGTTLDNLYIVTGITHVLVEGKFETTWVLGFADAYGRFEGAPNVVDWLSSISSDFKQK